MSLNLLFDTSAYSNLRKGNKELESLLADVSQIYMPVVVIAELEYGFLNGSRYDANHVELERFLSQSFVQTIAIESVELTHVFAELKLVCKKAGKVLSEHDLWIAALAKTTGYELVTCNQDFAVLDTILLSKLHIF